MTPAPPATGVPWRALLILGRVSNLPTVWSNCLAGWLLGGGGEASRLLLLGAGATCLYVGGMYLNDAFDAEFDRQHRPERPIPSGAIGLGTVWMLGFAWLAAGWLALAWLGWQTALWASVLVACVLLYDAVHKMFALSPVLMALCRFLLLVAAASATQDGVTGFSLWHAVVLAAYIVGLSAIARKETGRDPLQYWPCLFLAAPLILALIVNRGEFQLRGLMLGAIWAGWVVWCLRYIWGTTQRHVGRCVSGLLAGIVLGDWLSIGGGTLVTTALFLALFGLALLLQRFVPAT